MEKIFHNSYLKQATKRKLIFGGEVQKKGSKLIWEFDTNDNERLKLTTKVATVITVNDIEIHINKGDIIKGRAFFVNKGIVSVENELLTCRLEFFERKRLSPASRFSHIKNEAKLNRMNKVLTELYKQESEEIQTFANVADEIIGKKALYTTLVLPIVELDIGAISSSNSV